MHNVITTVFQLLKLLTLASVVFLTSEDLYGQNSLPKNLKQAVRYLDKECPDGVKAEILIIDDDSLKFAVYPFAKNEPYENFRTIYHWTSDENGNAKLTSYLESNGIFNDHSEVLLYSFKQYLLKGQINEKEILDKFVAMQNRADHKQRLKYETDSIEGVYIPKDLSDCFAQIDSFWNESQKTKVKSLDESEFAANASFGFGMWIRNNWGLWGGSRLSKYFNDMGVYHPDNMSGIILVGYHRHLNTRDVDLRTQVESYQRYWENLNKAELRRRQEEFSDFKVGDTVEFNYNKGFVSEEQEEKYAEDSCIAKGIVTELDTSQFLIKVKIIQACDRRGIVYYDNEGDRIYDPISGRLSRPPKRVVKKVKANREQWFEYSDWDTL